MARYVRTLVHHRYELQNLKEPPAKASPHRSRDVLAGIAAESAAERVAAQTTRAEVPLDRFLAEPVIPYEQHEVTRLIIDTHVPVAFQPVADFAGGLFSDWLLTYQTNAQTLARLAPGITPEMAAAVTNSCAARSRIGCQKVPRGHAISQHH